MKKNTANSYNIVIRDENCDNMIKQTIEFLQVVKGLKNKLNSNINISIEDVKEPCCVYKGQVTWGYSEIVKLLMNSRGQIQNPRIFGSQSPYAQNDVMNETFTQVNPSQEQVNKFHEQILLQGDHDTSDQLDSPNKVGKFSMKNVKQQEKQQQPVQSTFKDRKESKQIVVDQITLDNECHSRFLDELKSGGD